MIIPPGSTLLVKGGTLSKKAIAHLEQYANLCVVVDEPEPAPEPAPKYSEGVAGVVQRLGGSAGRGDGVIVYGPAGAIEPLRKQVPEATFIVSDGDGLKIPVGMRASALVLVNGVTPPAALEERRMPPYVTVQVTM